MTFKRLFSYDPRVTFCDACASVCDARCEAGRARDRAIERAIAGRFGIR